MTSTSSKRQHLVHATGKASAAAGYDALLKDDVYWPASVLSEVLNLTVVDVLSMGPAQPLLGQPWSHPNPVAYLPQLGSGLTPNMVSSSKLHANLAAKCNADSDLNKLTSLLVINITSQWSRADITECHSGAKCTSSMGSASVMPKVLTLSCLVHVMQQHFLNAPESRAHLECDAGLPAKVPKLLVQGCSKTGHHAAGKKQSAAVHARVWPTRARL